MVRRRSTAYVPLPSKDPADGEAPVEEARWRIIGGELLSSIWFQAIIAVCIILNAIVIGLETDVPDIFGWKWVERFLLLVFATELVMRIVVVGPTVLFSFGQEDLAWSIFDCCVVVTGLLDFLLSLMQGHHGMGTATLFRIIRLCRIVRIFRIVTYLKQVYLLVMGFAEAATAVFWVSILMSIILYSCSVVMVRTIGRPEVGDPHHDFLDHKFGSIVRSMLTLFELMSSPNLPEYQAQGDLLYKHPLLLLFLVFFIVFCSFGMIALLTGVISESMFVKNEVRLEEAKTQRETRHSELGLRCQVIFQDLDKEGVGEVTREEVEGSVANIGEMFKDQKVEFSQYDLEAMVNLMDTDHSGSINCEEFTHAVLFQATGLSTGHVQEMHYEICWCKTTLTRICHKIDTLIEAQLGPEAGHRRSGGFSPRVRSNESQFSPVAKSKTVPEVSTGRRQSLVKARKREPLSEPGVLVGESGRSHPAEEMSAADRAFKFAAGESALSELSLQMEQLQAKITKQIVESVGSQLLERLSEEMHKSRPGCEEQLGIPPHLGGMCSQGEVATAEVAPRDLGEPWLETPHSADAVQEVPRCARDLDHSKYQSSSQYDTQPEPYPLLPRGSEEGEQCSRDQHLQLDPPPTSRRSSRLVEDLAESRRRFDSEHELVDILAVEHHSLGHSHQEAAGIQEGCENMLHRLEHCPTPGVAAPQQGCENMLHRLEHCATPGVAAPQQVSMIAARLQGEVGGTSGRDGRDQSAASSELANTEESALARPRPQTLLPKSPSSQGPAELTLPRLRSLAAMPSEQAGAATGVELAQQPPRIDFDALGGQRTESLYRPDRSPTKLGLRPNQSALPADQATWRPCRPASLGSDQETPPRSSLLRPSLGSSADSAWPSRAPLVSGAAGSSPSGFAAVRTPQASGAAGSGPSGFAAVRTPQAAAFGPQGVAYQSAGKAAEPPLYQARVAAGPEGGLSPPSPASGATASAGATGGGSGGRELKTTWSTRTSGHSPSQGGRSTPPYRGPATGC